MSIYKRLLLIVANHKDCEVPYFKYLFSLDGKLFKYLVSFIAGFISGFVSFSFLSQVSFA